MHKPQDSHRRNEATPGPHTAASRVWGLGQTPHATAHRGRSALTLLFSLSHSHFLYTLINTKMCENHFGAWDTYLTVRYCKSY